MYESSIFGGSWFIHENKGQCSTLLCWVDLTLKKTLLSALFSDHSLWANNVDSKCFKTKRLNYVLHMDMCLIVSLRALNHVMYDCSLSKVFPRDTFTAENEHKVYVCRSTSSYLARRFKVQMNHFMGWI